MPTAPRAAATVFEVRGLTKTYHVGDVDVPTSGQVLYRNVDLTQADDAALTAYRRRHVGFVFQFYNLIPSLTALETRRPYPAGAHCL
jgi:predicted ABC-type transport system involved in lysophospholipase L1 biosynthesis ATPase subunit